MIAYDYAYDFANHPYQSEFLDQDSPVLSQSFRIPAGVSSIHGVRVKLSKYGDPGPVHYGIGRRAGANEIFAGVIPSGDVLPVFELLVGGDFPPAQVVEGETLYLNLWVEQARQPLDAYRVYGPNTRKELVDEGNARVPYWWHQYAERLDDVNAPLPVLYAGAGYPDYDGGCRLRPDGTRTWSIAFCVLTDLDRAPQEQVEQQFEFAKKLLAPPFSEWQILRDEDLAPAVDEVTITAEWGITNRAGNGPVLANAVIEIKTFLARVMGIAVNEHTDTFQVTVQEGEELPAAPVIIFQASDDLPVSQAEAFQVHISPCRVLIQAGDDRGFLRAAFWLEDVLLARRAPYLPAGEFRVSPRYGLRMVPGIYPAPSYFMLREAQVWTPGYMWRLARAGYNAVYFQAGLEDFVEDSRIFPELNDPEAPQVIERLRRCVELGAQYGIDFYWDIKTGYERKFPESVYQQLPEIRAFEKFGNFPCTGQALVLDFLNETISHVFSKIERLKGVFIVYDTEGFYSCITHNSKDKCPHCRNYPVEVLSTRLFETIKKAVRVRRPDNELVLFTYICDEPWNYRVIEAMPDDVILAACYSQLKELDRGGVRILTDDYSLCSDKPSDYFLKVKKLARQKGLRFIAKTEDTFGQEFVSTPFTPCLEQHQRRWDALALEQVDGYLSQYLHIGFMPTPCQDLARQNIFEVSRNGQPLQCSPAEKLRKAAVVSFGHESAGWVLKAWEAFSTAIRDYFPYTWGVCRYPGPLQSAPGQPFYLDPERVMPRRWARGYVNDLKWTGIVNRFLIDKTKTWDERVVARCFQGLLRIYELGIRCLEEALRACRQVDRAALIATLNVAQMQSYQVKTMVNLIAFLRLRAEYFSRPSPLLRDALIYILEAELQNASAALRVSRQDSRVGFSCEGDGNVRGGHFNAFTIATKIADLEQTLQALYAL